MTYWLQQNLTPAEIGEVLRGLERPGGTGRPRHGSRPIVAGADLMFSAIAGHPVRRRHAAGRWLGGRRRGVRRPAQLDRADPPPREVPQRAKRRSRSTCRTTWRSKMGTGWSVVDEDTMGEHQTAIWLGSGTVAAATDAAAGWGGDRITLLERPERGLGDRLAHGLGHRGGRGRVRGDREDARSRRPAVRARCSPVRAARPAGSSSAATTPPSQKVAGVLGLAG